MADDALVIFTPSGRRGRFADRDDRPRRGPLARRRHRLGLRRPGDLRPLPGDAGPRRIPEARHRVRARPPVAVRRAGGDLPIREGAGRRPAAVVHGRGLRRRPDRRPAREPGPPPGRAQGPRRPDVHGRPGRPAPLRRGHAARARLADRRPRPAVRGARARVAADRARGRPRGHPRPAARARGGQVRGHRRGPRGRTRSSASGRDSTRRPTASRSTSARRRSPATWPTWPTARSSPATA